MKVPIQKVIQSVLTDTGWTMQELAERLGYKSYVNMWYFINEKREMPLEKKKKLAKFAKYSLWDFI